MYVRIPPSIAIHRELISEKSADIPVAQEFIREVKFDGIGSISTEFLQDQRLVLDELLPLQPVCRCGIGGDHPRRWQQSPGAGACALDNAGRCRLFLQIQRQVPILVLLRIEGNVPVLIAILVELREIFRVGYLYHKYYYITF